MCRFITLVVQGSDRAAIAEVAARHQRDARPSANPSVAALLAPDERQFLTTRGSCDCFTILAAEPLLDDERKTDWEARLAKKGWSQAKIERWRADREKAAHTNRPREQSDNFEQWAGFLNELLALDSVKRAGVLVHDYRGEVATEKFDFTRVPARQSDLIPRLIKLRPDELMMFERGSQA